MKFVDVSTKKVNWKNRNYLFAGTILVIAINIIIYATCGGDWNFKLFDNSAQWEDFSIMNFLTIMFAAFSHSSWMHVLLNMLCFAFVGFYVERKYGTFGLLLFVLLFSFTAPALASHVKGNVNHHGFSGVIFAFHGFVIIDFISMYFRKNKKMMEIIIGIIIVVAIYVMMSFATNNEGTLMFLGYPYDLVHNMAHYSGFFLGMILGVFFHFFYKPEPKENN